VKEFFVDICQGEVERHEVPNLGALNFLLAASLGGGGTVSLRLDAQGKTLSHALLTMVVRVPRALLEAAARGDHAHRASIGLEAKPTRPNSALVDRRVTQRRGTTDETKSAAKKKTARRKG
jgi:hypothetical protein